MLRTIQHALATLALFAPLATAQTYYSVDVTNDVLYSLDIVSGAATLVGPLNEDVATADLAWHQGALYGRLSGPSIGTRIGQITTKGAFAGKVILGALVNGGGYQGGEVAGLASNGTALHLSYSIEAAPGFNSNRIGEVDPVTGTITLVSTIPTDADVLGFANGQFWSVDGVNSGSGYNVYRGATVPNVFVGNSNWDLTTNPGDVEVVLVPTASAELVTVGGSGQNLVRISRLNGARTAVLPTTGLQPTSILRGLAAAPDPCGRIRWLNDPVLTTVGDDIQL